MKTNRKFYVHALAMFLLVSFEIISLKITKAPFNPVVIFIFYLYNFTFFYVATYWYIPKVMQTYKSAFTEIVLLSAGFLVYVLMSLTLTAGLRYIYFQKFDINPVVLVVNKVVWRGLLFYVAALSFWFARYRIQKIKEEKEHAIIRLSSEKKALQLEAAFIKSQFDAHLLGNVLNNVYARIHNKTPYESEIILLAANILTYCVQHNDENGRVSLYEDTLQLNRIIALHQALADNQLKITFDMQIHGAGSESKIPPLLFSDLVLNVFKHGDLKDARMPGKIFIGLNNGCLHCTTENKTAVQTKAKSSNIGLDNTRARLEKHYRHRYKLVIDQSDDKYLVDVKIWI